LNSVEGASVQDKKDPRIRPDRQGILFVFDVAISSQLDIVGSNIYLRGITEGIGDNFHYHYDMEVSGFG
jgi:hypothetical protein